MALIRLRRANEEGLDAGTIFVNTDQIVAVTAGQNTTEIQTVDGRTQWVKETPEEVVALVNAPG